MGKIEPTARGDMVADIVRSWYEHNKPSWWDDRFKKRWQYSSDSFMIDLINAVYEAEKQISLLEEGDNHG